MERRSGGRERGSLICVGFGLVWLCCIYMLTIAAAAAAAGTSR